MVSLLSTSVRKGQFIKSNMITCSFIMDRDAYNTFKSIISKQGQNVKGSIVRYMQSVIQREFDEKKIEKTAQICYNKVMDTLTKEIFGKVFADKGYISQKLFEKLLAKDITLATRAKKKHEKQIDGLLRQTYAP